LACEDLGLQEATEVSGSKGIKTPRGFIEEEHFGLVEKRADQTQALNRAGRECAHLTVESASQLEPFCKSGDT